MRKGALLVAGAILLWPGVFRALQPDVGLESIEEALALGRTAVAAERTRFEDAYRVIVARAPIDYVDVVTPFRRIVLAARVRADAGGRGFGQRDALALLREADGQLDVYVELTFHPLNTYVGVPAYDVALIPPRGRPVTPRTIDRVPRWVPRVGGFPPPVPSASSVVLAPRGQPLLGGTIVARFDVRALDPKGVYDVEVRDGRELVGLVGIALGRMR